MVTTSVYVTVKAALIDALAARAGLSSVTVGYQWDSRRNDQVYLGSDGTIESRIPTIKAGRKLRDETVRFEVVCLAIDNDGSPDTLKTTETRALTYLSELEDQLADDVQIDGLSYVKWALLTDVDVQSGPLDKGWETKITATVEVEARLQ